MRPITGSQVSDAKDGDEEREEEKQGFSLSEEERAYYISALQVSKEIVKSAGLPVSDVLVGEILRKTAQNLFWIRTEGVEQRRRPTTAPQTKKTERERIMRAATDAGMQVRREKAEETGETCEGGEHCGEEEKINEYTETTINDIIGDRVEILDIQEVEEGGFGGRDITVEGIGTIRTYSKVLGGQIQHLKDGGKLPSLGTVERRQSKNGREYFNFSLSSSFMQGPDPKTMELTELARQERELNEFMGGW